MNEIPELLHVFPGFGPAGTQLRMVSILNALGKSFRHRIIALDGNVGAAQAFAPDIEVSLESAPAAASSGHRTFAFRNLVKERLPAAVVTYNWGAIEVTLGARFAACCPVIHNECGFGVEESGTLIRRRVWTRRILLNTIFRTVVTSETMFAIARHQYKITARKVQFIRTGVDVTRYRPQQHRAPRETLGLKPGALLFGYLGGLRAEKNLGMLVRAFHSASIPGATLVLAGDGPCRQELMGLVAKLDLGDKVIFAGHQTDSASYLAMLDVFVMSSDTEQVSNALLEAMASGLPVVCTDVGDSRALLGEAANFLAAPRDEQAYVQLLRKLSTDAGLRARLGSANRIRAVTCYPMNRMIAEYGKLFEDAVARRSAPQEIVGLNRATERSREI